MSDVPQDPSPAKDGQPSGPPAGDTGGSGDGRTIDNLQKEFQRKLDKGFAAVERSNDDKIGELRDMVQEMVAALRGQPEPQRQDPVMPGMVPSQQQRNYPFRQQQQPSPLGANSGNVDLTSLDTNVLVQVLQHPSLSPNDRSRVETELRAREIDSRTAQLQDKRRTEESSKALRDNAWDKSQRAFPALRDKDSDFFKKVATRVQDRRKAMSFENGYPMEVWDAANEVAREMNVEVQRGALGGFVAPTQGGEVDPQSDPHVTSEERQQELAQRFAGTLPSGKKFDMKRLQERAKEYGAASDLYVHPGLRGRRS